MKKDSLAILFSITTTLTFSPVKIYELVKKYDFNRLVGPDVLPNRLNAAQYLDFLNNVVEGQLDVEVPLGERVRMWYLHDGAPPHFARPVTEWLNTHFPDQYVGRNGPVAWPPRLPDLNACDFSMWSWMKQLVYGNRQCPETIKDLQQQFMELPEFLNVSVQTCYDVLKPVLLAKNNIFNIHCKKAF